MIRAAIVALCLALATPASPSEVFTGEHEDFTRITVPIDVSAGWSLNRTDSGFDLLLGAPTKLDLTNFFERIGRELIADVSFSGEVLSLKMRCGCLATTFEYLGRFVVIDIVAGPQPTASATGADPFLPVKERVTRTALPIASGVPAIPLDRSAIQVGPPASQEAALANVERELIEDLADASTRGVLNLVDRTVGKENPIVSHRAALALVADQPSPGIEVRSANSPKIAASSSDECWPEKFTDVSSWFSESTPFDARIAAERDAITDENNRFDASAVENLAKAYVFYGFGQEALRTLDLDGIQSRSRNAVRALAKVIDGIDQTPSEWRSQIECPGPASLWALVATAVPKERESWNVNLLVQTFKGLPRPLQEALGSRVADKLRMIDGLNPAVVVLNSMEKNAIPNVKSELVRTEILLQRDEENYARRNIEHIIASEADLLPAEVLRLADIALTFDSPVPIEIIERLKDQLFTHRNEALERRIREKLAISYAHNRKIESALSILRAAPILGDHSYSSAWSSVAELIVDSASDQDFFEFAFSGDSHRPNARIINDIATRLVSNGFPERASELLSGAAVGAAMEERQYLRAIAAMQMADPALARTVLAGVSTPRADAILASEPWLAAEVGAVPQWRDGKWAEIFESENEFSLSTAVGASRPPSPVDPTNSLRDSRAMISDSIIARGKIDSLLARSPIQEIEEP